MKYMSVKEAASKWGLKERRVRVLCQEGRVKGVTRAGRSWLIPSDATKPQSVRAQSENNATERLELLINPTFCDNPLYEYSPEEKLLCEANSLFFRGDFNAAEAMLNDFISSAPDKSYLVAAYILLMTIYADKNQNPHQYMSTIQTLKDTI